MSSHILVQLSSLPNHLKTDILFEIRPENIHLLASEVTQNNIQLDLSIFDIGDKTPNSYQNQWYSYLDLESEQSLIDALDLGYLNLFYQLFEKFEEFDSTIIHEMIAKASEWGLLEVIEMILSSVDEDIEYYLQGLISSAKGNHPHLVDKILELGVDFFGLKNIETLRNSSKNGGFEVAQKILELRIIEADEDVIKWILEVGHHDDIALQLLESGDIIQEPSDEVLEYLSLQERWNID